MKRYIHIKKTDREFIAKAFNITPRMVNKGIRYESDSELACKVRKLALKRGGIVMTVIPEAETLYDADGYMRQYLPNGVLLEFEKEAGNGGCDVYHKGEVVRHYDNVKVSDIPAIQNWAAALR